ncbi:ClpXP protease specificity-enhancing factor SspB [Alphaproteobacteria bacterium endosymbiont of Tiliacea citrago]|uniref:ClpXP protease specificity-enhancing factor SspB n=1 Tax=Alphaproteobacteria bacterium endosymbiont of Tiliacea citrago TaxID=3077944 RepID=UPI00313B8891
MDYNKHLKKGFIDILKNILKEISQSGIKEGYGLAITFLTNSPHVVISERIKWPNEMKVYLSEGTFEDLRICDTFFEIVLFFDDEEELLKIPYVFVTKIEDTENNFELNFLKSENEDFFITDENIINIDFEKKK